MKFNTKPQKTQKTTRLSARINTLIQKRDTLFRELTVGTLYSISAFLLGLCSLPFGSSALGVAYLCAADKKLPYIFAGLSVSLFFCDEPAITAAAYIVTLLVRVLIRLTLDTPWEQKCDSGEIELSEFLPSLFSENVYLRMATSAVGVFCISLYTLIKGGFLYYDLIGAIISMIAAPLFVLATYGEFSKERSKKSYLYLSRALIGALAVYSANAFDIYGISLSVFIAMLSTLYVCKRKGIIFGMGTGAVLGLAYSPILSPAFFIAALAAGALWKVSSIFAATAAFGLSLAYSLYVSGIDSVISFMPAALSACLLFAVLDKTFLDKSRRPEQTVKPVENSVVPLARESESLDYDSLAKARLNATLKRQKTLCDTLLCMSEFFSELGERMKTPILRDSKDICDAAFDATCASCSFRGICFEQKLSDTTASINALSASLHRNGKISRRDVSEPILSICGRIDDIIDEINHNYSLHERQLLLCDKTEIFATDYKAMHDLLSSSLKLDSREFSADEELSKKVASALKENEAPVLSSVVFGSRRLRVILTSSSAEALKASKNQILSILEKTLERSLVIEKLDTSDRHKAAMTLTERKSLAAEVAIKSSSSIFEKEFCGDSSISFESVDGLLYSLISDGMGSGRDAALTSSICVMFMQKMLTSGARCTSALKMLNAFLRNKGSGSVHECSATLDVMELDLVSRKASFYKSGAAPSFIMREGRLYKLASRTLPLGIIKELDAKRLSFDISEGDLIVMVSDGVTSGREECPWLSVLLKENANTESTDRLCDLILKKAREENTDDDISVSLIKIGNNL